MTAVVLPLGTTSAIAGTAREPNALVIEKLEKMLDQARSGELTGFACATLHPGDLTTWGFAGRATRGLLGALVLCQGDVVKSTLENL